MEWLSIALTAVYVVATIFISCSNYRSARASREQTEEMKRQYNSENRPYITAEVIYLKRSFFVLRFTNHGKRIASHTIIQIGQKFIDSINEPSIRSILDTQKENECIIGIGQHYDLPFGTNKYLHNKNKAPLTGHINYSDGTKTYHDDISIDLERYATFFSVNSDFEDLLTEVKTQTKELKKLSEALKIIASHSHTELEDENM